MKISIIIPIYNVAPYVERCLYSALIQSYEDIELVLVDDCGTDNSMNIVSEVVLMLQDERSGAYLSV